MTLKLFTDRSLVLPGSDHVQLLDAFWGMHRYDPEGAARAATEAYRTNAHSVFEVTSDIEEAEAALFPIDWSAVYGKPAEEARAKDFLLRCNDAGKSVFVFFGTDAPSLVDWPPNSIVFRPSLHRSTRKPNEFILPFWSKDPLADRNKRHLPVREKQDKPVIGFCGYAPPLGMHWSKTRLKETIRLSAYDLGLLHGIPERTAHAARARALLNLRKSKQVQTNFIIRSQSAFANSIGALLPGGGVDAAQNFRAEFERNMIESDYILCSRGYGNYSIRFYETLCMGRVPLLIDTDCVLPLESTIDWEKFAIIVPEKELNQIDQIVAERHRAISPSEFTGREIACRELYVNQLSPLGFFRQLHTYLPSRKVASATVKI